MLNRPIPLLIFGAGFGTRLRPLTEHVPKPLIEVGGTTLLDHALNAAKVHEVDRIAVNAHHLADQMVEGGRSRGIEVIVESMRILDTGGGLKNALTWADGPIVFTLNSDAVWGGLSPLEQLALAWDDERMDALLLVQPSEKALAHKGRGDFDITSDGQLIRGTDYVYTGAQIMRGSAVSSHPETVFSMNKVWDALEENERLFGLPHAGSWIDVGNLDSIAIAEDFLRRTDV